MADAGARSGGRPGHPAIVAAVPGRPGYYTNDHVGVELAAGDLTVDGAVAFGEAELVS